MTVNTTDFKGLLILEPKILGDSRGYFMETYNAKVFNELGIDYQFVQDNQSKSSKGVLRGLHYQNAPYAQTKLVRVLSGAILDVVIDLRKNEPTFGKTLIVELSSENRKQLLIPKGFGHGFAVQPLQGLSVVTGILNDGKMVPPTFMMRSVEEADVLAKQIIKPGVSKNMQILFRLNATDGSASKADVPGYRVGGKTGTAEKVVRGRYSKDNRLSSFIGAFPMDNPRYAILIMLDEPKALPETYGFATAGWNAVPTAGKIIERIAPILGIKPVFTEADRAKLDKLRKAKKG